MLRCWYCCFLTLGVTVLAWGELTQGVPLSHQVETADWGKSTASPTFGLQVQVGLDDSSLTTVAHTGSVTRTGYVTDRAGNRETSRFSSDEIQLTGIEEETEEPLYIVSDGISMDNEWQVLPVGLMYKSYLAGEKEPRIQSIWLSDKNHNLVWETALGGRFSLLRYGTSDPVRPEGWEFDFEGAALPRVDPHSPSSPLIAVDFRIGMLSAWRFGRNAFKAGYYHLSSHVGDEFLIANPGFVRRNYVRDSGIIGWTHDLTLGTQIYGEIAYAFGHEDGAMPLEFQYGIQYSPRVPGIRGAPFGGINGHTRQEFGYETSVNIVAGWQWWNAQSNHTFRIGGQHYDGPSLQYSFVNQHETLTGWGMWFDY